MFPVPVVSTLHAQDQHFSVDMLNDIFNRVPGRLDKRGNGFLRKDDRRADYHNKLLR